MKTNEHFVVRTKTTLQKWRPVKTTAQCKNTRHGFTHVRLLISIKIYLFHPNGGRIESLLVKFHVKLKLKFKLNFIFGKIYRIIKSISIEQFYYNASKCGIWSNIFSKKKVLFPPHKILCIFSHRTNIKLFVNWADVSYAKYVCFGLLLLYFRMDFFLLEWKQAHEISPFGILFVKYVLGLEFKFKIK